MTIFKLVHMLDKQVETCHIHLMVDACNLVFILKYKNGVKKSHLTPILDSENLQLSYTKPNTSNELMSQSRTLMDALQNFSPNLVEITLEITPLKLLLRNFVDNTSVMPNITRTQVVLGAGEFNRYTVNNETNVTFCLKEVKALIAFSESANVPITINFEIAGRPILFTLKSQVFEAQLLLSTLSPDYDSQSDSSLVSRHIQPVRKKNAKTSTNRVDKSYNQKKKSVKSNVNGAVTTKKPEKRVQLDKTLNQNSNVFINIDSVNNTINGIQERNLPEQNCPSVAYNQPSTSSASNRNNLENQRKRINSIFSNITKRKSKDDEENNKKEKIVCVDLKERMSQSPPRQHIAKKAKMLFNKCFEKTFDPRMLPGHDRILAKDSDESNSD
ncbi:hypothetical protein PUN28_003034 [Cardiocondyla obscurior]